MHPCLPMFALSITTFFQMLSFSTLYFTKEANLLCENPFSLFQVEGFRHSPSVLGHMNTPDVEKVIEAHCGPRGDANSVDYAKELAQMRSHFPSADFEQLFSFLMEWKKVDLAIKKYQAYLDWAKVRDTSSPQKLCPYFIMYTIKHKTLGSSSFLS